MKPITISPSNLSTMAAPEFCPRCFWRLLHNRFKIPFRKPMPQIMHFLDAFQKQLARVWIEKHGRLPEFFGPFKNASKILDVEWVSFFDKETGITVRGKIDIGLGYPNEDVVVVDDKTALDRGPDDVMHKFYRTQTNCYGHAMLTGKPRLSVIALALLHYEFIPQSDKELLKNVDDQFAWTKFQPKLVQIELNPKKYVLPYLGELREYWEMEGAPESFDDCPDCKLLESFSEVLLEDSIPVHMRSVIWIGLNCSAIRHASGAAHSVIN